jgi:ribosomal protein S18 acetylase RimI-like enzyme
MSEPFAAEPARPQELEAAFGLVFQYASREERRARVDNALRLVRQGELDPAGVLVVRQGKRLLGAMVCLVAPGASGLVWPPQAEATPVRTQVEDVLLRHALTWMRDRGAKLGQTLVATPDRFLAAPLERHGFAHVTRLWYLRHELDLPAAWRSAKPTLTYQTYVRCNPHTFQETLLATYADTQDCPEINGVREVDEILEGHRAQGTYDPERWWLVLDGDRPIGVVLLTEIPDWHGWDLSYLGVVPQARGRGAGKEITLHALRAARAAGAGQLTLAVDDRNVPARNLYQSVGFESFDQREVYLAIWRLPERLS